MTWSYQMNFDTIKEGNAALRKVKDSPIRKSERMRFLQVLILTLLICILLCVIFKGTFLAGYTLLIFVISFPIVLLNTRNQPRRLFASQLPARYSLTLKDGRLKEEITTRDGSVSQIERSLSEILQAEPFCKGLLIRFTGPSFLFLPKAAFRQISPLESAAILRDAIAAQSAGMPDNESAGQLPRQAEDNPEYGTLYFDLPSSHIYRLYLKCILHLYRNPFRYLRSAFRNARKSLIFPGFILLMAFMLYPNPRFLLSILLFFVIFMVLLYALNLLLVVWKYYLLEKKNALAPHCGPQHISLYEDHLTVCRTSGSYQFLYPTFYNVYETKEAFYLLQKHPASVILIPRWAFGSPQEETMFVRTLRGKIMNGKKH